MDSLIDTLNQFASAHPWYFAMAAGFGGFFVKSFIFTKNNARRIIRWWFDKQRTQLRRLGKTETEIAEIMEEEADLLLSAAQEAKDEAAAAKTTQVTVTVTDTPKAP